jgi:pimeloyl-ACP methyl ester carboxylesterase
MPQVHVNGVTLHYDRQGEGEPLILIPFLTADHGCFAFQLPAFAPHFSCFSVDLRGAGASDRGEGGLTIPLFASDIAAFMAALGLEKAHVLGLSLGGAVAMTFAAAYPDKVLSVSLHSTWPKTDLYVQTVVESWQAVARTLGDVPEMVIQAIFPWCFTPELYQQRPDFIASLAEFVRARPKQSVSCFIDHANAVIAHDALAELPRIKAPTHITFGARDVITSTRFAEPLRRAVPHAELEIFEESSHAPFFEEADAFNARSLAFLKRQIGSAAKRPVTAAPAPA